MASNALSPLSPDGAQSRERTPERGEKSERVKRLLGRMAATEAHEQTGRTEKEHNLDKRLSAMLEAALPALLKSRTPRRSPRLVFPKSPVKKAEASPPNLPTLSPPLMSNHATTSPTRPSDTPRGSFTRDPLHPQPPAPARPTQRSPLSPSRLPSSAARPAPTSGDAERLGASAPVARLLPLGSGAARGTGGSEGSRADMKERALGAPSPKVAWSAKWGAMSAVGSFSRKQRTPSVEELELFRRQRTPYVEDAMTRHTRLSLGYLTLKTDGMIRAEIADSMKRPKATRG